MNEGNKFVIKILRTDLLRPDVLIQHPLVRIHLIDKRTGHFLTKAENEPIKPISTQPYLLKGKDKYAASWNQDLPVDINLSSFVGSEIAILFEVLDYDKNFPDTEDKWFRIAWAFLALPTESEKLKNYIGKENRLQLYKFSKKKIFISSDPNVTTVFLNFGKPKKKLYPSTLYVTLLTSSVPSKPEEAEAPSKNLVVAEHAEVEAVAQKKPTIEQIEETSSKGTYTVKFSNDGKYLACASGDAIMTPISVYDTENLTKIFTFSGHHHLVYEITWSNNNELLLSASSDGTAKLWNFRDKHRLPLQTFQHTSFVYTAKFHPISQVVVTGAYDGIIRFWDTERAIVTQQLKEHTANVNCLTFDHTGSKLFSGDGTGLIKVWLSKAMTSSSRISYECTSNITHFKGTPINDIYLHPQLRKIIVHTRGSAIHTLDLRFYTMKQKYVGFVNREWHIKSCVTPDGQYIVSGSEDSKIYVWEEETGNLCNTIDSDNGLVGPVTCTACHPSKTLVAASSYGAQQPILIINLSKDIKPIPIINPLAMSAITTEDNTKSIKSKYDLLSAIPEPPPLASSSSIPLKSSTPFTPEMKRRYSYSLHSSHILSYDLPKSPLKPIANVESLVDSRFIDGTPEELERKRQKRMRRIRREKLLTELHSQQPEGEEEQEDPSSNNL